MLEFIVVALALARVTRLVTTDFLTRPLRAWVMDRFGEDSRPGYLIECDWCFSIWAAPAVVVPYALWWDNRVVHGVLLGLAACHVVGWLAHFESALLRHVAELDDVQN